LRLKAERKQNRKNKNNIKVFFFHAKLNIECKDNYFFNCKYNAKQKIPQVEGFL